MRYNMKDRRVKEVMMRSVRSCELSKLCNFVNMSCKEASSALWKSTKISTYIERANSHIDKLCRFMICSYVDL